MNAMPGGMRFLSEAPAAIEPSTMRSSYLRRRNEGSATVAIVAAVDTDEQHRPRGDRTRQGANQILACRVGPLQVIEQDDDRSALGTVISGHVEARLKRHFRPAAELLRSNTRDAIAQSTSRTAWTAVDPAP